VEPGVIVEKVTVICKVKTLNGDRPGSLVEVEVGLII
jgi:hypothetical protein